MITEIGLVAGDIWRILDEKGRLEYSALLSQISHSEELLFMAIGWLCREGHILLTQQNKKMYLELRAEK